MLFLSILACALASAEPVEPPPAWEYAVILAYRDTGAVFLAIDIDGGPLHVPFDADAGRAQSYFDVPFVDGPDGKDLAFTNVASALTYAGAQGWEVTEYMGRGQYLAKRRR